MDPYLKFDKKKQINKLKMFNVFIFGKTFVAIQLDVQVFVFSVSIGWMVVVGII